MSHLVSELLVLLDLLLRVPEPLIYLLLFQVQVGGELEDLGALGRATLQLFEEAPEGIALVFRLSLPPVLLTPLIIDHSRRAEAGASSDCFTGSRSGADHLNF